MLTQGHGNVLQLGIKLKRMVAAFSMRAAEFHAAERRGKMANVVAVDPSHAGFELQGHAVCPFDIFCPNIGCEPVRDIVGFGQSIGFIR